MLLVEKTIDSVVTKISNEGLNLESPYDRKITRITPPNYAIRKSYGGYCKLDFGDYAVEPELFESTWPPQVSGALTFKYTATTEAAAETLFAGNYHLVKLTDEEAVYETYNLENDYVLPDGTAFNDTLVNVFTWICNAARMNLTLNSTLARNPSPAVVYTTSGEQLGVDFLDALAAFFSHMFYISGTTLYLLDMASDNGSRTVTVDEFFDESESPVDYFYNSPCAVVKAGDYSQQSSYLYGETISETAYHNVQANIEAAIADILAYQNKARAKIGIPFLGDLPLPGEKISWTDTKQLVSTDMWIRARIIQYDFDNETIIIEGEGEVSAT